MSASLRYLLGSGAGRSPAATTAPPSATARTASTSASGRGLLLLQSTSRPGSHTRLELFTLRLQHGRPQQRDLLALLQTAKNFGVIEVADTEPDESRSVRVALLHEHNHRAAAAPTGKGSSTTTSAATPSGASATLPVEAAAAKPAAPRRRGSARSGSLRKATPERSSIELTGSTPATALSGESAPG